MSILSYNMFVQEKSLAVGTSLISYTFKWELEKSRTERQTSKEKIGLAYVGLYKTLTDA